VIEVVIFPLFYATLVFGLISEMTDNVKLVKFTKTSKSAANWILGIMFSIFITFTTAQGITGASFDSLATRGAKYALSSYVPVIGNYLKEGFDLVLASCIVIKNALGLSAIIVLVYLAIIPIIKILTLIFTFKILSAIMEPISDKKFANMLYSTSNALTVLVTIVICITFTLLIMFMLIIYTCNWGLL
jgi:stage III sporulation protein AE